MNKTKPYREGERVIATTNIIVDGNIYVCKNEKGVVIKVNPSGGIIHCDFDGKKAACLKGEITHAR